jgi:hypothetical protein
MYTQRLRVVVVLAVALVTALAGADRARAAGAVLIDACQTLSVPNTTYKLTTDLTSCDTCLVVAANKITIDLQGHSITNTGCPGSNAAISDQEFPFDVLTVKNGTVSNWFGGVFLSASTRVSVLGVTATNNAIGIIVGPQGLVKSSEASGNVDGIVVGSRGQVEQCNAHHNGFGIVNIFEDCLITKNTANDNVTGITVSKCTVSYNTANNNVSLGIIVYRRHSQVTRNVALDNGFRDYYFLECPIDVTYNESTNGFPVGYEWFGSGCHFVNND